MRVYIDPTYTGADRADGGIRRVVEAQQRYLARYGWDVTSDPDDADLIANHGANLTERPGVPMVSHNHGAMWWSYHFGEWGDKVNKALIEAMARANAVTAPSRWVANAISRGMLIQPEVVYHGVDADEWAHNEQPLGYVLWNKARADQVSDPDDMQQLAALMPDVPFLSTFGEQTPNVFIIGSMGHADMRPVVQRAGVYLATARETFGIGTLEALAAGVPVAGWRYGGQEEIVIHGETGYLAPYGDYAQLATCVRRCLTERDRLGPAAQADARQRWGWEQRIAQYADLYTRTYAAYHEARPEVSVIMTAHRDDPQSIDYLTAAVSSVKHQTLDDWQLVLVSDGNTDLTEKMHKLYDDSTRQVVVVQVDQGHGLANARNFGFTHARGHNILHLDYDDMLAPNALDVLASALDQNTAIHIAYGHLDIVNDAGENRQRNPWPGAAFSWHGQIAHLNQLPYSAMLRREVLERSGGYRTRDWRAEDAALWTRLTSFGFRAAKVTEESTLIYRLRSDSKSADEARTHADRDGDWTAWYPWRLAGDPYAGMHAIETRQQPNPVLVPFGAQGQAPRPLRAWPVHHHQEPLISIIVPVGPGHARYLVDALDSVQAQTFPFWECIVVNDGPKPLETPAHPWARVINPIIPLYDEKDSYASLGAGAARNRGLDAARAPLVLFLDADDILPPGALDAMVQAYVESGGRYVYGDWATLDDETRIDGPMQFHEVPEFDQLKWLDGAQHAVTLLVETAHARAVGGFDESLPAWEDWDFLIKLAVGGYCGVRIPQPLLLYRLESGQRRKLGDKREAELLQTIRERYAPYATGDKAMCGCGGTPPGAITNANAAMDMMMGMLGFEEQGALAPLDPNAPIRMEFIGDQMGAQTWRSQDGQRSYKASRSPSERYLDVDPRDVARLESIGLFARVILPVEDEESGELVLADEPRVSVGRRGRKR